MHFSKKCWEIRGCERQANGKQVHEFGECIASRDKIEHSCMVLSGTLGCGDKQCTAEEKEAICKGCEMYLLYNHENRTERERVVLLTR